MSQFTAKNILRKTFGFLNVGSSSNFWPGHHSAGIVFFLFLREGHIPMPKHVPRPKRYAALFLAVKQERIKRGG